MKFLYLLLMLCLPGLMPGAGVDGLSLPWKLVRVSSPVPEIVAEATVEEGAVVKKGQVLARLHSEKEEAEHKRAMKILEKKEFDSKAAKALVAEKITSKEKALEAEIELQLAQVDVELAKRKFDEKTILSPLDGVLVRKLKQEGESVDRVDPMFEIINIDRLFLQFYVERKLAASLAVGQEVPFRVEGETGKGYQAKVDFVSPGADAASGLFRVKLLFVNDRHPVQAGVRVTADFPTPESK